MYDKFGTLEITEKRNSMKRTKMGDLFDGALLQTETPSGEYMLRVVEARPRGKELDLTFCVMSGDAIERGGTITQAFDLRGGVSCFRFHDMLRASGRTRIPQPCELVGLECAGRVYTSHGREVITRFFSIKDLEQKLMVSLRQVQEKIATPHYVN
jgi:hypothetical protein